MKTLAPTLDSLSCPFRKRLLTPDSLVFVLSVSLFVLSLLLVPAS